MDNRSPISAYSFDPCAEGGYYPCAQIAEISLAAKSLALTIEREVERVICRLLRVNLSCSVIREGDSPHLSSKVLLLSVQNLY